jgi:TP901-1 family phage major tail protein
MAGNKIAGVDVLLEVEVNGTLTVVGGQSGATLNRDTSLISVTSKDDGGWESSVAGTRSWGIEMDAFLIENDTALDLLEQTWLNGGTVQASISLPSGKAYSGSALIESLPMELPQDDAVSISVTLTGTGALEIVPAPVV